MERIWRASGDFWQKEWSYIYDLFGQDDFLISVVGTSLITIGNFWLFNILYLSLDLTGRPAFLLKYKVQPDKNCPVKKSDFVKALKLVLFNQFALGVPFITGLYYSMKWRGCSWKPEELPSPSRLLIDLIVFTLIEEAGFYYSHRLFHHPKLYKHIHKIHHEWTAPIGIVAIYAHPVEHIIANMLPPALGPVIMGSHLATTWLFYVIVMYTTVVGHSGYHLPFLSSPEAHDFHHLKFNTNYGALGLLDWLHGTDTMFRESLAYKRDYKIWTSLPASQRIPDPPKKKGL